MRNLKKFLALVLAMMMVFSLMLTVNAADPAKPTDFEDKDNVSTAYAEAVNVLSALDIIQGDAEATTFRAKDYISRAEVAALIYRIATTDTDDSHKNVYSDYNFFTDVNPDDWFAGYVNYCRNAEYIKGVDAYTFDPYSNITGYEVLAMILRVVGYDRNNEFTGPTWSIQTAARARSLGMLKNVKEGTLGAFATREVVAELLFQAMQADLVDYNMLYNYFASNTLLADTPLNRAYYSVAIADGRLTLPLNADLLYQNFDIVGKSPDLAYDKFGRPSEAWVKDLSTDTTVEGSDGAGDAELYIPNGTHEDFEDADETALVVPMTPVKVYDNAITECQLTKDINNDKSIKWADITEVLNGNAPAGSGAATGGAYGNTLDNTSLGRGTNLDALHTTTDYIGATGRTTEIYKYTDGSDTKWVFVYIDTYLGKVTDVTPAIKDSANHTIKKATATVALGKESGSTDPLVKIEIETDKYEKGELILVQTYGSNKTTPITVLDVVDSPEKAPLTPADVPLTATNFLDASDGNLTVAVSTKPTIERVTVRATVGSQNDKMGIITTDGKTYYASNTFLAAKNTDNPTVLDEWYDIPVPNHGITNNMIERTFDIVLDQHGYIVGMDEVVSVNSSVGVITGVDSVRVATGKYLSEVEAYMTDGTTQTFRVPRLVASDGKNDELKDSVAEGSTTTYKFFASSTDADAAWIGGSFAEATGAGMYGAEIGVGSLVKFSQVSIDGSSYWKIEDYDGKKDVAASDKYSDLSATAPDVELDADVGTVLASAVDGKDVKTGVTDTLFGSTRTTRMLDDNSIVFVTEYDYRYNAGDANEGGNTNKSYKVYNGFKTLPTIEVGTANTIVYQRLDKNPEYFLIGKTDDCNDYVIKDQAKINVDESYLLLSRGATYAEYSEYNVLRNGQLEVLKVANGNDSLNAAIEATLTGTANHENQLFIVTGRNSKGYVTSVIDTYSIGQTGTASQQAMLMNNGIVKSGGDADDAADYIVQIAPDGTASAKLETADGVRAYGASVLQLATKANGFLTIADGCIVKLVNRDLNATYDITLNEAIRYANGVDGLNASKVLTADNTLKSHGMVFELNEYGYVCALYVIDGWTDTAS